MTDKHIEEFNKLSWELLEAKVKYYRYPHLDNMSDGDYDSKEKRYLELCELLNRPNTIQSMVGVDLTRPSVQCIIGRLQ